MQTDPIHIESASVAAPVFGASVEPIAAGAKPDGPPPVSIIMPVYNGCELTRACLTSLLEHTGPHPWEVIIIDNASSDGTVELLGGLPQHMHVIRNPTNAGFARACNQGALQAQGTYLLFLNNDTVVTANWLDPLITAIEQPEVGVVGCKLLYPDGRIQHAGISLLKGIPDHPYRYANADLAAASALKEMDMVTGACLMVSRSLFTALAGFDEIYRNGVEDVDFCLRVRQAGYRVLYQPETVIYHHEGQSAGRFNHVNHNLSVFFTRWKSCFDDAGRFRASRPPRRLPALRSVITEGCARIVWEGSQFVYHSLALINREICLRLIEKGLEVSILPYEKDQFSAAEEPRFEPLVKRTRAPLTGPADVHVRHQWPPNFTPPDEGHWVIIQPWEFGSLPKAWIRPMSDAVDEIWVPSHFVRHSYIQSGIPDEKVFVLPNGVNTRVLRPGRGGYPLKTAKRFKFLFVGGTIWRKGIDILLDVYTQCFSSSDDVCLVIKDMGGGSFYKGQTAEQLIQRYQRIPKAPAIEHIDRTLTEYEMARLYNTCNCLVHPYRGEGFGLPIAEAMACELPVIVTGYGAALDYCTKENSYLVSAQIHRSSEKRVGETETVDYPWLAEPDRVSLQSLMKHLYEGPVDVQDKAQAARKKIEADFTWDNATEAVLKRLNEIVRKPIARQRPALKPSAAAAAPVVSIVVRISDDLATMRQCVQQLSTIVQTPHQVIFIVGTSPTKIIKWLKQLAMEHPNCRQVQSSKGAGWASELNLGIQASTGPHILILDPHVVLPSDSWLCDLLECLLRESISGCVGPVFVPAVENKAGTNRSSSKSGKMPDSFAAGFRERNRHRRIPVERVSSRCMLFRRGLFDEIGCFDDLFDEATMAAEDFCLRAAIAGYRHAIAGDVDAQWRSGFQRNQRPRESNRLRDNQRRFHAKWHCGDSRRRFGQKLSMHNALVQADQLQRQGDFEKATASLVAAIHQAPNDRHLYFRLAEMLMDRRQTLEAIDILKALPNNGGDGKHLSLLGRCEETLGHAEKAQDYAERALALDPRSVSAMNVKGLTAFRQGDAGSAETWFKTAMETSPDIGESCTNLGSLKWAAGASEEALGWFERGFILSPTSRTASSAYHNAVVRTQSFARAVTVVREARTVHPGDKQILFFLIAILIQGQQFELAMQEIEQAMIQFGIDDGILSASLEIRNRIGPYGRGATKDGGADLSLCMIVKNEEQHLANCLMGVKPIVDEIIVVDTGSADRTKQIATAFGAKVVDFDWTDDFAAARNYSISLASGRWVLILDADECIAAADHPLIRELIRARAVQRRGYRITTRNYTSETGTRGWIENDGRYPHLEAGVGWFPSTKVRLFPKAAGIRFVNPVHEVVDESLRQAGFKIVTCNIPIHHYGKLNRAKVIEKGRHYYQLGLKKLDAMRGDPIALRELAIQASEIGEYEQALTIWRKLLDVTPEDPCALMNAGYAFFQLKQYASAMACSRKAMALSPESREAALNYAAAELVAGDPRIAVQVLEPLLKSHLEYPPAHGRLAAAMILSGRVKEGVEQLDWLSERGFDATEMLEEQARELQGNDRTEQAEALLKVVQEMGMATGSPRPLRAGPREPSAREAMTPGRGTPADHRPLPSAEVDLVCPSV
jgi:GT2 family glycosyltransferase/Flp pilus assembly protein TadD